jgi:hypothetical protein
MLDIRRNYKDGLALAQLAPGLAAQLAIYIGYVDYGIDPGDPGRDFGRHSICLALI